MLGEDLRKSVLQTAIQGKLVEQHDSDSDVDALIETIQSERDNLVKAKVIKNPKVLPSISEDDMPFDIPNSWRWVRLGDLVSKIGSGSTPTGGSKVYTETGIKFLRSQNIYNHGLVLQGVAHIPESIHQKKRGSTVFARDLLLNITGGSIGRCAMVPEDFEEANINQHISIIRLIEPIFRPYIHLVLISNYIQKKIMDVQVGMSREGLSNGKIELFEIPLPPLEEQKRIVAKVEEVMKEIDQYKVAEKELQDLKETFPIDFKKSLFQAAVQGKLVEQRDSDGNVDDLMDEINIEREILIKEKLIKKSKFLVPVMEEEIPFDIPDNWKWVRLEDIGDIFNGNSINAQVKKTHYEGLEIGYPYIGTKDVKDNEIVYDNGVKIPFETNFKIARKGSTLVCSEGGSAGKKVGIVNQDVCFGNKLFAIQQFKPILEDKFIYYFTLSPLFKNQFNSMLTGIIGGVSVNNFKKILIPLPPLEEQKRIVEKLEQLLPLCNELIQA